MNPAEPVNSGAPVADNKPVSPVAEALASPTAPMGSPADVSRVEGLVAAAQEAVAVQTANPVAPVQTSEQAAFATQFGPSESTQPSAEPPDLMTAALEGLGTPTPIADQPVAPTAENSTDVKLDPSINTIDDLLKKGPQVVENPPPAVEAAVVSEQTPADKLKEQIADAVDAFLLNEVTKDKVTA